MFGFLGSCYIFIGLIFAARNGQYLYFVLILQDINKLPEKYRSSIKATVDTFPEEAKNLPKKLLAFIFTVFILCSCLVEVLAWPLTAHGMYKNK